MANSAKQNTVGKVATAADRGATGPIDGEVHLTENDVARRAYDFYLARGREPGRHLEDWLRAEQELRRTSQPTAE